jgi:outer membrane protein insertion porin family
MLYINNMLKKTILFLIFSFTISSLFAQRSDSLETIDYSKPKDYTIDTVTISGVKFLDQRVLANMSGLSTGATISLPGDEITKIIKKFWEHGLFEDVNLTYKKLDGNRVSIDIYLKERPRISKFTIEGVSKSDREDIKEKINLRAGSQITENVLNDAVTVVKKFYNEKGFFNVKTEVIQKPDSARQNSVDLTLKITKNKRVKIQDIVFAGNNQIKDSKLRKSMKKTKRRDWKFWNSSKFIEAQYKEDKDKLIEYYNEKGFRDAKIVTDSVKVVSYKRVILYISLYEGQKYYFRNVTWVGNTKYPSEFLSNVLGIKRGDVFNQKILDKRLQSDDDAVSSLYLDNGYLFFNVNPTEVIIDKDSIDFEMRIYEGKQASFNEIFISGNTKTNEHVVRRELRTLPGELFSKSDIIRSVRELATLGHFEPEKIEPVPLPNPANATVDLQYKLEERANDQLEVSGGWGGYYGFIGTVGIKFSNFSYRNFFKWKEWRPVPSGDGQTLSLRLQTNGTQYRSYNLTFADPWFGGKKPNSFSLNAFYSHYSSASYNSYTQILESTDQYINTMGVSLGLGKRLKWPDDYFTIQNSIGYTRYEYRNYPISLYDTTGSTNSLSFNVTLGRNSLDQYIYPRSGSSFSLGVEFTPPYSLIFGNSYIDNLNKTRYNKWVEYHKWTIKGETYLSIVGNLVLMTRANFGILARYKKIVGYSPIENFNMGGSGMMSYNITNEEIIPMRGYTDGALTPYSSGVRSGHIYDRFTCELRYPVTLKEQATIFGAAFAEAGNCWSDARSFNPFTVKRAVGFGVTVFLPMFGILGFDMGYGFDKVNGEVSGWQPQFRMGQQF